MRRPSPALAIALIALFVSLGGTGYAAVKITGKNVKDGSLTGKDVRNRSLGAADIKRSALGAGPAGPRGPQGPQGPRGASAPPPEAVKAVRAASSTTSCQTTPRTTGEFCGYDNGVWANYGQEYQPVGYFKDGQGLVHLQGSAHADGNAGPTYNRAIFFLPPGYRPSARRIFLVRDGDLGYAYVEIRPDGLVFSQDTEPVSYLALDGISFRP
ncbi:MAG TPA: hypothetical protein VGF21_02720 [Thermoleophilaceae bacterium]